MINPDAWRDFFETKNEAAASVIVRTIVAINTTDDAWNNPGSPSVTDYAAAVVDSLKGRYLQ